MKHVIASVLVVTFEAQSALAGGMDQPMMEAEPMMEPEVVVEESTGTSGGFIVPLMLLAVIAAVASSGGDSDTSAIEEPSDMRLKEDIVRVGATADGLPLYHFRYIGQDTVYRGVMAQDVLSHRPEAVTVGADGFYRVNYGMLGLEMTVVD